MLILGIVGSLRSASYNGAVMAAFAEELPPGVEFRLASIGDLPHYNADLDGDTPPESARVLKAAVTAADGLVIATPEFNYGVPGVLKNALDWVSRPAYKSPLALKPVTCFGAATPPVGTARAQGQLKQILLGMLAEIYPAPELTIGDIKSKIDDRGNVTDEALKLALKRRAVEFSAWVKLRAASGK